MNSVPLPAPHPLRPVAPSRGLCAVFLALGLAGCAPLAAPDRTLPEIAVPATWSATPAGASDGASDDGQARSSVDLARWWRNFDDPEIGVLVERALLSNTSLRAAREALAQARAVREVQAAGLLPSLGGSASAQRARPAGGHATNRFQAGLDAAWEIDLFGGRASAVEAAEADARAAEAGLAGVQVSLAAEVALAYLELRGLQNRLAIARRNLAAQNETLQLARWRAQAGLTTSVEVEQARAAAEQTAAQVPLLETGIAQASHALEVLTGQAPGALKAALADARPVPQPVAGLAQTIPAETLRQRPDVRQAEERVSAALARVSQAEAARYPGFRLGGSIGLSALTLSGLGAGGAIFDSLLAAVSVPLFDGGALQAQVRVQQAALEQARIGYQATVLGALKEVEDALVALRGESERLARLRNAAEAAANAALLAQNRYASGLIDFQVVLDTQRTLLNTQDSVANTLSNVSAGHVRLYKALGGGWT